MIEKRIFVGDYALKDVIATLEFINTFYEAQGFEAYIDDCYLVVKHTAVIKKASVIG